MAQMWYNTDALLQKGVRFRWQGNMAEELTGNDQHRRRCPMLGHDLNFSYCRAPGRDLPCRKILDCWWQTFDVQSFLHQHFTEDQIQEVLAPRKPKMATLVELINRAKASSGQEE